VAIDALEVGVFVVVFEVVKSAITDPRERRFRCARSDEIRASVSRPLAVEVLSMLAFRRIASLRTAGRDRRDDRLLEGRRFLTAGGIGNRAKGPRTHCPR
jgi:hypothetical protein